MWQGLTIALREGIESFLIVALTALYLQRTGRRQLLRAVWLGTVISIVSCAVAGYYLAKVAQQSLWEGIFAFVSAALVGTFLVYMKKVSSHLKADIEGRVERVASGSAAGAGFWGVLLFTIFMVTREGMETALMIDAALFQLKSSAVVAGAALGIAGAIAVGVAWLKLGKRVNFKAILNFSSLFLALFLLQLLIYGFHEFAEAGVWPNSDALHAATEAFGPDGKWGHLLAYALALIPTAWLVGAWLRHRRQSAEHPATQG